LSDLTNPIIEKSFAIIDSLVGKHNLNSAEYAIARRIIHTTADFELLNLLYCSSNSITSGIQALKTKIPIITDVTMIREGIKTMVEKTYQNKIIVAVKQVKTAEKGKTRTETGLLKCCQKYPSGIYVVGNAPTALLALCQEIKEKRVNPALIIGVPVGFVSVLEAKQALTELSHIPQIQIKGNKGGSTVASAIINALLYLGITITSHRASSPLGVECISTDFSRQ
jgi:precorrin-8X/cobalt-precorrin-8 methylmutase